jgi:uncharacterized protein (DUF4415 family)
MYVSASSPALQTDQFQGQSRLFQPSFSSTMVDSSTMFEKTMISDEPDEDADSLDDEKLLVALLDGSQAAGIPTTASAQQDWPSRRCGKEGLVVDADILTWFRTNHEDWQQQIRCVLRAWIDTRPGGGASSHHSGA